MCYKHLYESKSKISGYCYIWIKHLFYIGYVSWSDVNFEVSYF